ncbi:MAG: cobyrinate a,c-diamide synthase [Vallitaleaceae bacterium]|nr:cobyrinate a,c-diamide synthase [Vallitaleaceae bacterium]
MKGILFAASSSGSGKTTVTSGIIRALHNKGYRTSPFKTGPDYIDKGYLEVAAKNAAGNLDLHLQGDLGMLEALSYVKPDTDYCVIEGAMGYYDGIYNTFENSSYAIGKKIGVNTILIYTPKGEMFTAVTKIKGMVDFGQGSITGVILNKVSEAHYDMLRIQIENHVGVKVLGYLPTIPELEFKSRHLGLIQSEEMTKLDSNLDHLAELVEKTIELQSILNMCNTIPKQIRKSMQVKKKDLIIGVAKDKAFSFFYRENLEMLKSVGKVIYFSPLSDLNLPDCDLLYLGGGYPELYKEVLSSNHEMLEAIRLFSEKGGHIFAECGGFMYLNEAIEDYKMVGIFKGEIKMTSKLQRFGYIDITLNQTCFLGEKGDRMRGHEFHRSRFLVEDQGETASIMTIKKTGKDNRWYCGYLNKNTYGGYPHFSFVGNKKMFTNIINRLTL